MKTTVFLTGATGVMGWQGMKEILRFPEKYHLRILARPSKSNRKKLRSLLNKVEVVWGDLTCYEDVLRGVAGSDIVLHVGGMVSPRADYRPEETRRINIGAANLIRRAVLAQPDEKQPKVVYIGSVAQMGDRREPFHWGRVGDPLCVSPYDHYGITKVLAERVLTGYPIKRWVSLRQSGILHPAILTNFDPIMFHVPVRGVLEWATVEDSGRLLERVCRPDVPDNFWNNFYNISSGREYRLTNYEFESLLLQAIGCPRPERIFDTRWFATRNFHGMWYLDADRLEEILHFRANIPVTDYFHQLTRAHSVHWALRFSARTHVAKLFPNAIKSIMRRMAGSSEHGTQWWIRHHAELRIRAFYGSLETYTNIPDWEHLRSPAHSQKPLILHHGYDETKPIASLTLADLQQAAAFRGGTCMSDSIPKDDGNSLLKWHCAEGHTFCASPRQVLLGGHWCPMCFPYPYLSSPDSRPWQWDRLAKRNPFLSQLWSPLHAGEDNVYGPEIFLGWEKRHES